MKTTPEQRQDLRLIAREFASAQPLTIPVSPGVAIRDAYAFISLLLDNFAEIEAELAALRRVDAEMWRVQRSTNAHQKGQWVVDGPEHGGRGKTLSEALAEFDRKAEQYAKEGI